MKALTLDFETYYDEKYSLKRMTIAEYVNDPRFHVHGLAIRYPDGRQEFRTDVETALAELQREFGQSFEAITVIFHNAYFDMYVLRHRFEISVKHFTDTMLLSYHVHGRKGDGGAGASLEALAERYDLACKGDLSFMSGVRHPSAQQTADLQSYAKNDVELTYNIAMRLLPDITRPEVELPAMMHTVRLLTERDVSVDTGILPELANRIHNESEQWLAEAGACAEEISKDSYFVPMLERALARTHRRVPLKQGKNGLIPATAKKDQAMQALLNDMDPVVAALAQARIQGKSEDQLLARLDTLDRITKATGGVLPIYLVYGGAHTLRFSGGQKFNIQNLGKDNFGLDIRRLLKAKKDHVFIIGDLAQIEARVLAWLAGQDDLIDAFKSGKDIYSEFASEILGQPVRKPKSDDTEEDKKHFTARRHLGKFSILGLGYSMGALRCLNTLHADPVAAPLFDSGVLSPIVCRQIVQTYRDRFPRIPLFWSALDDAFHAAIHGTPVSVNLLRLERRDGTVLVWLPSGRALRYPGAKLETTSRTIQYLDKCGEQAEFAPSGQSIVYGNGISLYGGKIAENVVQAVARDILVEAILSLEKSGLPVLFHVHDEVIVQVPESEAGIAQKTLKQMLETVPAWASGLPLAAEVRSDTRYGK